MDNALAQFLAHHMRSLELAVHGSVADAILEHAFAMHFLEDSFAAGHLVMSDETWKDGNPHARRRHDFYDAKGLAVGRAMGAEPCGMLGAGSLELSGLTPCWVTTGDGYLGTSPDASDRAHVARAVTQAELMFAIALDAPRAVAAVEGLGEREQLALGQLIEPVPWWTVSGPDRRALRSSAARTRRLVRAAVHALESLRAHDPMPALDVGTALRPGLFETQWLEEAFSPCRPREAVDPAFVDDADVVPCGSTRAPAFGTVGVSLLRPILVEWAASSVAPSELHGESKEDLGWAIQLFAAANATAVFPPRSPVDFLAPAIGVSAGLSYRWGTYLPGRLNRALAELNVGISEAIQYDGRGQTGGRLNLTFLDQELRWPIAWELLTSYMLPLDLEKGHEAGQFLFFNGIRAHEVVANPTPAFWGLELETLAIALSKGRGAYPIYGASPELRLYLGVANPSAVRPSFPDVWGPTVGVEFTAGYATFL
jgi:hypothetical protein